MYIELAFLVARYAARTGYLLDASQQEEAIVTEQLKANSVSLLQAAMAASYRPRSEWSKEVTAVLHDGSTTRAQGRLFWQQVVVDAEEEAQIMRSELLGSGDAIKRCNATTRTVAELYTDSPYPVWDDPVRPYHNHVRIDPLVLHHTPPHMMNHFS